MVLVFVVVSWDKASAPGEVITVDAEESDAEDGIVETEVDVWGDSWLVLVTVDASASNVESVFATSWALEEIQKEFVYHFHDQWVKY